MKEHAGPADQGVKSASTVPEEGSGVDADAADAFTASEGSGEPMVDGDEERPGDETPGTDEASDEKGKTGTVTTGDISGSAHTIVGNLELSFEQQVLSKLENKITQISREHFRAYSKDEVLDESHRILVDPASTASCFEILTEQRILLLVGEAEVGKGKFAQYLAAQLIKQYSLEEILLSRSPEQNVSIDFHRILADSKGWARERVIVIRDAFNRNTDLIQFAESSDALPIKACRKYLTDNRSFLILTSDDGRFPQSPGALIDFRSRVDVPPPELSLRFLKREASTLANRGTERSVVEAFVSAEGRVVVDKLRTIPRIQQFVQIWLVLVLGGEISLEEALDKAGSLEPWLLRDRARDLGTLSSILALVLGHAHPSIESVNWFQFDRLRREIDRHLRLELRRGRDPRDLDEFLHEPEILQRIEAEVAPAGDRGDLIRFTEVSYAGRLWDCLLGPGRMLLVVLVPLLDRLTRAREYFLRNMAARALGRIGQIDPYGLIYPRMNAWARSKDRDQIEALGSLVFGALGSEKADYEGHCLSHCRRLVGSSDFREARSGILALRDVGTVDLELAMREIRRAIESRLVPQFRKLEKDKRFCRHLEAEIQQTLGRGDVQLVALNGKQLGKRVYDLLVNLEIFAPGRELEILFATQYTLVGLCFELGAARVLQAMGRWMPPGKTKLAPFLAFLFLRPWGMAHVLERFPIYVVKEDSESQEKWSPILYGSFRKKEDLRRLADFLLEIYLGSARLPSPLDRIWHRRFFDLLKQWALQACEGVECRAALIMLLQLLLEAPDRELQDQLFEFLQHDSEMAEKDIKFESFATEVLATNLLDAQVEVLHSR